MEFKVLATALLGLSPTHKERRSYVRSPSQAVTAVDHRGFKETGPAQSCGQLSTNKTARSGLSTCSVNSPVQESGEQRMRHEASQ